MKGRFIARAFNDSGWLHFWKIERFNDKPLRYGDVIIESWDLYNMQMLERILKEKKKYLLTRDKKTAYAYRPRKVDKIRPKKEYKMIGL